MKELIKALAERDQCRREKNVMMSERDRALADLKESQRRVRQLEEEVVALRHKFGEPRQ